MSEEERTEERRGVGDCEAEASERPRGRDDWLEAGEADGGEDEGDVVEEEEEFCVVLVSVLLLVLLEVGLVEEEDGDEEGGGRRREDCIGLVITFGMCAWPLTRKEVESDVKESERGGKSLRGIEDEYVS